METTTETRTDASLVFEILLRAGYTSGTTWEERNGHNFYYCADSNTLALHQDWTRRYSTGQDAPR